MVVDCSVGSGEIERLIYFSAYQGEIISVDSRLNLARFRGPFISIIVFPLPKLYIHTSACEGCSPYYVTNNQ
jgi:hypothetical protein